MQARCYVLQKAGIKFFLTYLKIKLKLNKSIPEKCTYIIKEDGGIAMAQFANLPSRLFHILFGQSPGRGKSKEKAY